jgi:hypothetical protein
MHAYLEAIGFSNIHSRRSMELLQDDTVAHCMEKKIFHGEDGRMLAEYSRDYASGIGLTVCGEIDGDGVFHAEYSFPYIRGGNVSTHEEISIERHAGKDSYAGACDDARIGITLIFYLINMGEYRTAELKKEMNPGRKSVAFSALAKEGTILLPTKKDKELEKISRKSEANRKKLINAARDGDEDAIESLTMDDIDIYSVISQRLNKEDVLSIVDSYFMPYGIECDQYSILGTIRKCEMIRNGVTDEILCRMEIESNDLTLDVSINKNSLMGEPKPGRRFKGLIWLQGLVYFGNS